VATRAGRLPSRMAAQPSTTGGAGPPPDGAWPRPAPPSHRAARGLRPRGRRAREAHAPRDVEAGAPAAPPQAGGPPGGARAPPPPLQGGGPRAPASTRAPLPPSASGAVAPLAAAQGLGWRRPGARAVGAGPAPRPAPRPRPLRLRAPARGARRATGGLARPSGGAAAPASRPRAARRGDAPASRAPAARLGPARHVAPHLGAGTQRPARAAVTGAQKAPTRSVALRGCPPPHAPAAIAHRPPAIPGQAASPADGLPVPRAPRRSLPPPLVPRGAPTAPEPAGQVASPAAHYRRPPPVPRRPAGPPVARRLARRSRRAPRPPEGSRDRLASCLPAPGSSGARGLSTCLPPL